MAGTSISNASFKKASYLFLTNNSSKGVDSYIEKLAHMGIRAVREDFVTSVEATVSFLRERYQMQTRQRKIYVLGTESFKAQMVSEGFRVTDRLEDGIQALLVGFDRELTYQKLEDACILLQEEIDYFATNPDWVCPTIFGSVPDCGSICQMLEHATGKRPYFIGKPQPEMVYLSLKKTGCCPEDAVLLGDRLYTDIACGVNAGIDTIFVLSGEGTLEDLEKSQVKPTVVIDHIGEVLRRIKE